MLLAAELFAAPIDARALAIAPDGQRVARLREHELGTTYRRGGRRPQTGLG